MKKRKGKLFKEEAKRVVDRNWETVLVGARYGFRLTLCGVVRRAMVRAYKRGLKDGKKGRAKITYGKGKLSFVPPPEDSQ